MRWGLFKGWLVLDAAQLRIQEQKAQAARENMHRRLLAEGYEWDGMDGYSKTEKADD